MAFPTQTNPQAGRLAKVSVLIADADNRIAALLRRVLLSLGFGTIHMARDGSEAIRILHSQQVDLLITDWEMEPMNGISLLNYVRGAADSPNPRLPIIMLTGKAQKTHVETARDAGMTEFVVKPFSVRTLCDRIILVVEHPRSFILSKNYVGPDRRRRREMPVHGKEHRADTTDQELVIAENSDSRVLRINDEDVTIANPEFVLAEKIGDDVAITDIFSKENIRKAQQIINSSQGEFLGWVTEDVTSIERAYRKIERESHDASDVRQVYDIALIMKSQAGTFGFDLASSVADSLMFLLENCEHVDGSRLKVIRKHIDVLYVIFHRNIQGMGGKIGKDLMDNLSLLTRKYR